MSDRVPDSLTCIKKLIVYFPDISVDDLMVRLKRIGYTPSRFAISTIRLWFRNDLRILVEEGLLDANSLPPKKKPPLWLRSDQPSADQPPQRKPSKPRHHREYKHRIWWRPDDG